MPATALKVVQLFAEPAATWGSAARATVRLIGVTDAQLQIEDEVYQPEQLGNLAPGVQSAQVAQTATGSITQDGLYQDICYLLDGTFGKATGSANVGTGYARNYVAPLTGISSPQSYTMEFGTTAGAYKMHGALPAKITIAGEAGKVWTVACDLVGQKASTVTLSTAATSTRSVQLIRVADTTFQVGAWANSTYSTVAATLISFSLEASPQRHVKTFAGSLYPSSHGENRWTGQLTTVVEFNASAKTYVDALLSGLVQRRIQLTATGIPAANRIANIQFAGTLVDGAQLFEDRDGNMTVSLTWNGTYNTSLLNWLKLKVTNELDDLP
jgi:hypothetical protein